MERSRVLLAEGLGTLALLATVVGSGIMGEQLSQGIDALALLVNAAATGAMLYVLIGVLAPVSGAHFNPAVTLASLARGRISRRRACAYVLVQLAAAVLGVVLAHVLFGQALLQAGTQVRSGIAQWLSEAVASAGLLLVILLGERSHPEAQPVRAAAYVFAAYFFTASTAFANPAVTLARAFTDSFSGIRLQDVPAFILAQCAGAAAALVLARVLEGRAAPVAANVDTAA